LKPMEYSRIFKNFPFKIYFWKLFKYFWK
jgi:hypothetical protein